MCHQKSVFGIDHCWCGVLLGIPAVTVQDLCFLFVLNVCHEALFPVLARNHSFMTFTRRGRAQVDACGRGKGVSSFGHPHRKLEPTDVIVEFQLWVRKVIVLAVSGE